MRNFLTFNLITTKSCGVRLLPVVAGFRDISDKKTVERETVEYFNQKPHLIMILPSEESCVTRDARRRLGPDLRTHRSHYGENNFEIFKNSNFCFLIQHAINFAI